MKRDFEIGDGVFVSYAVDFFKKRVPNGEYRRVFAERQVSQFGIIVGARYRRIGRITFCDNEGFSFRADRKSILVYQVAIGFTNRPIEALGCRITKTDSKVEIPWKK